ncbi:MAG TPA: histone deacetylase [Patescibacteria group bacterium]|nr:histone deacetylase [Patescibacteria group bacterium]
MALDAFNSAGRKPIIYSAAYDLTVEVSDKVHPVDIRKSSHVFNELIARGLVTPGEEISAGKLTDNDLAAVHTAAYIEKLHSPKSLAKIFEVPAVGLMSMEEIDEKILDPMRHQAAGSVLAGEAALANGWSVNLGGGYHHASADHGHGFCAIADVTLAINSLRANHPEIKKVMIIDLDAHQGDGYARDFERDDNIFIVDVYGARLFPKDDDAQYRINVGQGMPLYAGDAQYLPVVERVLEDAGKDFQPDFIFYVAGTDILEGDRLGRASVTRDGVLERDEMVFKFAFDRNVPIAMLFGGGYQPNNAALIADSIENLDQSFGLMRSKPPKP